MSSEDVFNKLIRTPKSAKIADLLTDNEYSLLRATSFEDFLNHNFNADTLEKLCSSEKEQLLVYFNDLERKFERNKKRICRKVIGPTLPKEPKVVVRYVPAPTVSETVQLVIPSVTLEGEERLPSIVEHIENLISEESTTEDLFVSLAPVELAQVMAPRELLIEEPIVRTFVADMTMEEIDLGPPGDAGAFLGTSSPMPLEDSQVRDQLLREFSSLRRPEVCGRFEDLEEVPPTNLMPPPVGKGICASTPITSIPLRDIRRHVGGEPSQLEVTEMSAIKAPAPVDDTQQRSDDVPPQITEIADHVIVSHEMELPSVPEPDIQSEALSRLIQSNVDEPLVPGPVELEYPSVVPVPDVEIPPEEVMEIPKRTVPVQYETSSSSNSSIERPQRVPRSIRKAPVFGNASIALEFQLRKHFEIDFYDDWSSFDASRAMIRDALTLSKNHAVDQARQSSNEMRPTHESLPADTEQHTILRELTTSAIDNNSIRELTGRQSKLYPIPERPQLEDQQAPALPEPIPIPVAEYSKQLEAPVTAALPDSLLLPEISLVDTNRELDIALINRSLFPDVSNTESLRIGVTNPDGEIVPSEGDVTGESLRATVGRATADVPIQGTGEPTIPATTERPADFLDREQLLSNEKLSTIFRLYLTIQDEVKCTKRNSILLERVSEIVDTGRSKLNQCKLFTNLMTLKRLSFIDIGMDEDSYIRNVVLRF